MKIMNVLYSTPSSDIYMPPLSISERQIIVGPNYPTRVEKGVVKSINVPPGRYDIGRVVQELPDDQKPDLTIVRADSDPVCVATNLSAVNGCKVLLVGDTHHHPTPLQRLISYAREEPFDKIVVTHDPHHLHWFVEAGIAPTSYIPNVNVAHHRTAICTLRKPAIIFVGNTGGLHPRRQRMLQAIQVARLPLVVQQAPAASAARLYNSFQISFNCSLNGDLNMRVFEVLAGRGFLITDRLSSQTCLERIFRRGEHYVDYESSDQLVEKLKHYLARPDECLKIAIAGNAAYENDHLPAQRKRDLLAFAFENGGSEEYMDLRAACRGIDFGKQLTERVRVYEVLQELSKANERINVFIDGALGARIIADYVDLPRLMITVFAPDEIRIGLENELIQLGVLHQLEFVENKKNHSYDVGIISPFSLGGPYEGRLIRASWLAIVGEDDLIRSCSYKIARYGFSNLEGVPWLFNRPS